MAKWMSVVDMYKKKNQKRDKEIKNTLKGIGKGLNAIGKSIDKSLTKINKEAEKIQAEKEREEKKQEKEKQHEQFKENQTYIKSLYDDLLANQKVVNTSKNPENVRKGLDNMLDILNEFEKIGEDVLNYYGLEINCKESSDMILKNYKQVLEQAKERSKK